VDRFKEVYSISLNSIEYTRNEQNYLLFTDQNLMQDFKKYHKEKAKFRLVRKKCNLSRTGMARIKKSTKDLTIKSKSLPSHRKKYFYSLLSKIKLFLKLN